MISGHWFMELGVHPWFLDVLFSCKKCMSGEKMSRKDFGKRTPQYPQPLNTPLTPFPPHVPIVPWPISSLLTWMSSSWNLVGLTVRRFLFWSSFFFFPGHPFFIPGHRFFSWASFFFPDLPFFSFLVMFFPSCSSFFFFPDLFFLFFWSSEAKQSAKWKSTYGAQSLVQFLS